MVNCKDLRLKKKRYSDNSNSDSKSNSTASSLLFNVKENRLKKVFRKCRVIHALTEPKNLLRLLRKPKVQTCISENYGLYRYECKDYMYMDYYFLYFLYFKFNLLTYSIFSFYSNKVLIFII